MDQPRTWLQDSLIPPEPEPDGHFVMIPLTQGKFTLVDEGDAEWIMSQGKWLAFKGKRTYYAARNEPVPGRPQWSTRRRLVFMHALIAGRRGADHVNRNGLDNRSINLRSATESQNRVNQGPTRVNTSGYKGVCRDARKWVAYIQINGRKIRLGLFADPVEAARAYNRAALEAWGEFAWLNPIPGESDPAA